MDNLVAATIVLADGSVKQLSTTSNPDLFWAIRGCGYNFGVVHEFVIKAFEQPNDVYAGMLIFPEEKLEQVFEKAREWDATKQQDEVVYVSFGRMSPDYHQPIVGVMLWLNSPSSEEFQNRFKVFYSLEPIIDTTRAMSYPESNSIYNEYIPYGDRKISVSAHFKHHVKISSVKKAWKSFLDFTDPTNELGKKFVRCTSRYDFYNREGMREYKNDETVCPTRDQKIYSVTIDARWTDDKVDKEAIKWLNQTRELFFDETTKDDVSIMNDCAPAVEDMEKLCNPEKVYGKENMEKLKELKRKYDPTCFFNKWIPIKI